MQIKKIILLALTIVICNTQSQAHHNTSTGRSKASSFDDSYRYAINTEDSHLGHFYIKKLRSRKKSIERVRIEQTIHLDNDFVTNTILSYDKKSNLATFTVDLESATYFFHFYLTDGFLSTSSAGSVTIFNKTDNTFNTQNLTLDPISQDDSSHDDNNSSEEHSH